MASRLPQIPERLLTRLWHERAAREGTLRAGNGRRLRVIYPGRPGTGAGPDFRDALIEEEGLGLVRGDVEVHVRQRDWEAHRHGEDPQYNGVILHVVGQMDGPATTLHSGLQVPVLSLEPLLTGQPTEPGHSGHQAPVLSLAFSRASQLMKPVHSGLQVPVLSLERLLTGRPTEPSGPDIWRLLTVHGYLPPGTGAELGCVLDRAGDSRFLEHSRSLQALIQAEDREQVLYEALMEALGYSQNQAPFLELAGRAPYRLLEGLALGSGHQERQERAHHLEGALLTLAGLHVQMPAMAHRPRRDGWLEVEGHEANRPGPRVGYQGGLGEPAHAETRDSGCLLHSAPGGPGIGGLEWGPWSPRPGPRWKVVSMWRLPGRGGVGAGWPPVHEP